MEDKIVSISKQLISFKTVTGNIQETEKAYRYIEKYLNGLFIKKHQFSNYKSLAISNQPFTKKKFDIILHGHFDVVSTDNEADFYPVVKKGKLYGRGSLDMKGGLACLIELIKNNSKSNKKILLLITSDEEIGGMNGTNMLINKLRYRADFFLTAEGEKDYLIKNEQKGVYMFKLVSQGKGDHSAYTWNGKNAILLLMEAYQKISKHFPQKPKDAKHWYSTINLGVIKGGLSRNSIPEYAEAEIDIRYCPTEMNEKKIENLIKKSISKNKNVSCEVMYKTDPMYTDKKNPLLQKLNGICKKILKRKSDLFFKNHGTNDARFAAHAGIPAIGFGPTGNNYHAKNEFVSIESLKNYYLILQNFIFQ